MKRLTLAILFLFCLTLQAKEGNVEKKDAPLKVGDAAPNFKLKGTDGKTYELAQFKGKSGVVVAWYPKADTPG